MPHLFFATNRIPAAPVNGIANFGDEPVADNAITFGAAQVDKIDLKSPSSGEIVAIDFRTETEVIDALAVSDNDLLVFIHGTANAFPDAIKRAAYNQLWLSNFNIPNASSSFDVLAFTWPSNGYTIWDTLRNGGILGDYRHDQKNAKASAAALCSFLGAIDRLRAQPNRPKRRRVNLLCHSMGNWAFSFAVERLYSGSGETPPAVPLFEEAILAAADEVSTTFGQPNGRLANLWRLAREITVYYANDDIAMDLSHTANGDWGLGYNGPANKADLHQFSPNVYEFVNCTGVNDYINTLVDAPDRSHQYYRQSPIVRADIVTTLVGQRPKRKAYDTEKNVYTLF
ncbi:putative Alpha/beta hydrolase [Azospirillaceae bacterium]